MFFEENLSPKRDDFHFKSTSCVLYPSRWTTLASLSEYRQSAGCALSRDETKLYIFGGTAASYAHRKVIDIYNVTNDSWTNNLGDSKATTLSHVVRSVQCESNEYDDTIVCPAGSVGYSYASNDVAVYKTISDSIVETLSMETSTSSYGMSKWQFVNDGTDEADIVLVSGGYDVQTTIYDTIQYLVLYHTHTDSPTAAPTQSPTEAPSNAPTAPPTVPPTEEPTESPSAEPSAAPTNPTTTVIVTRSGTAASKTTEWFGMDESGACPACNRYIGCIVSLSVLVFTTIF